MLRPFSIARALSHAGELITGKLTSDGDAIIDNQGHLHIINVSSLSFNTGFTDNNGTEIFTGDFLNITSQRQDNNWIVYFDEGDGRFNTSITDVFSGKRACRSTSNINIMSDKNYKLLCTNVTYIDALDRERAKDLFIVGNIFDKLRAEGGNGT